MANGTWGWIAILAGVAAIESGCVDSAVTACADDVVCPAGLTCALVTIGDAETPFCVSPQQQCSGDRVPCASSGGAATCHEGVCLPDQCGNLLVDATEACDDGNFVDGDGCSSTCTSDETCGNGVVDGSEVCDCGDAMHPSDSPLCAQTINGGTVCSATCTGRDCGDGVTDPTEACDDGNLRAGDGCSADCQSTETCGNTILDPVDGESCDTGDQLAHDGCTSTCRVETPAWTALENVLPRFDGALAYDGRRDRVVVFGGVPQPNQIPTENTTHEWDARRWWRSTSPVAPPPRARHVMAFDEERQQIVMFGGNVQERDTWTYDGRGWTVRAPSLVPGARSGAAMVYDPVNKRIVMFGGDQGSTPTNTTYVWDGTNWTDLQPTNPPPARKGHAMAFDRARNVIVMFGGEAIGSLFSDVWELSGSTWTMVTPTNTPPSARSFARMEFDPATASVLVTGGDAGGGALADAWLWNGSAWTPTSSVPATVKAHAMALDRSRNVVVLLGNNGALFEWDGNAATWKSLAQTSAAGPSARVDAAGATDPLHQELVMFGGAIETSGAPTLQADTWLWSGSWFPAPTPGGLTARRRARMVFDPIRGEVVMFGGCGASNTRIAETWVWTYAGVIGGHWEPRMGTQPPARCDHYMAWDGVRGRVIVFGGDVGASPIREQWSWNGTDWSVDAASAPPEMEAGTAAWDPIRRQVVAFGGFRRTLGFVAHDETWVWDGATWTQHTGATRPSIRYGAHLAWDPALQQLVLYGGEGAGSPRGDVFTWDGTKWNPLATDAPRERGKGVAATSPDGAGIMVVGGRTDLQLFPATMLGDTLLLRWDGPQVDETCTANDIDLDGLAGCMDPDCWSVCSPLCMPGMTSCPTSPRCGDTVCDLLEGHDSCPGDCP